MENKIERIVYELFRQWTKKAALDYPDLDFTIIDEGVLLKNFKESLHQALNSLIKTEKAEKRLMSGYDYGFVVGFIQGNLNTLWFFEYITKRSNVFKSLLINKALWMYLQNETVAAIKIQAIYEKMYEESVNLESLDYDLPKAKITDYNIDKLQAAEFGGYEDNLVMVFLKNKISEQVLSLLKIKAKNYLPDLENYLSITLVEKWIYDKEVLVAKRIE